MRKKGDKMKKIVSIMIFLLLCLSFIVNTNSVDAKPKINKEKISIYLGEEYKLKIKETKKIVKWSSMNKKIASVTTKGTVKAKLKGKATIIATVGKNVYKCKVIVMKGTDENKVVYNNTVFTKALYKKIGWISSSDEKYKVKRKEGIIQIFSILANAKLSEVPDDVEPLEGGLRIKLRLKEGTTIEVGVGSQIIFSGKRYYALPSVTDSISKKLKEFAAL